MRSAYLFLCAILISACVPIPTPEPTPTAAPPYRITPNENPFEPKIEDTGRQTASVTLTSVGFSESYGFTPPRAVLALVGYMPSVCNELRVNINPPDEQYRIFVEVYSLINPDVECDNVFQQFETSILLGTYSPGRYYVWINDALAGDFVSY
ncbi:MAG: hypothetical protein IPG80_01550 [Anaerolineales bacterium]|uniref:hypothetical protein n=1 Tax=Candidatus Villigracilis vicinus TaxID=3140679 RepID=UPI0031360779|nr:hypothetical protein [Anaerolineales bacterium]MBK7449040.1 hypothetical protein [Anaerolineales bacterium]MBK9780779.1 hypothetical protein [Anaerolineales bacterium]